MQTNTHRGRGRGAPKRGADTIAENMVRGGGGGKGRGGGGSANLSMESESCISHPSYTLSAHYLVISRGMVLKEGGINQLSWVNVLQPHYEPWVAL